MSDSPRTLEMTFDGSMLDRKIFLRKIREQVMSFTGELMTLDALINEIAKNIFDHAAGKGSLRITACGNDFEFEIKDGGCESYDVEYCKRNSRLAGNGTNFGTGIEMIEQTAQDLKIALAIDASRGFSYSGVYTLGNAPK